MQPKHFLLLSFLRENSREKLTTISRKTRIPISTLFDLLKELQESIIIKNTTLINFERLGYHTRAQIFLRVGQNNKEKLKQHLILNENVNNLFKINNGWDFLVETVHQNIQDLDKFLDKLNNNYALEDKQLNYLINDIKREGFLIK
jgi:DNA-binding Lrp family transcriptional regulator